MPNTMEMIDPAEIAADLMLWDSTLTLADAMAEGYRLSNEKLTRRVEKLEFVVKAAGNLVQTARQYFPQSIRNSDRFTLEITAAAISAVLAKGGPQ